MAKPPAVDVQLTVKTDQYLHSAAAVCPPMQIVFKDLTVKVQVKSRKEGWHTRTILHGVSGVLEPARFTAVMGASGAGKTTLLDVLAGYSIGRAQISGTISVNGETMVNDRMRDISGFVHQEDIILDTMTVREALTLAACLRLPGSVPRAAKVQRALDVAATLNLNKALDNVVGGALLKGISGGEKRRLSLGMAMITNPSVLFLDEPTSGLDTYTAHKVVAIMSSLARHHGRTVVATIHQPSSDIFHLFDDLIVLAEGCTMFHGPAQGLVPYFAALGHVCPTYTNPSDFLFMSVLNPAPTFNDDGFPESGPSSPTASSRQLLPPGGAVLPTTPEEEAEDLEAGRRSLAAAKTSEAARVQGLLEKWRGSQEARQLAVRMEEGALTTGVSTVAVHSRAPITTQLAMLSHRTARNALRHKLILKGKLVQTVFLALVVGLIYLNVGDDLRGVQDRQGSLFFLTVQSLFGSTMGVLTIFGAEKVVFKREYLSRMYSLPAYFFSRWLVELPLHILMPVTSASILYWMIGYQPVAQKFWWFALVFVLMENSGAALGVFVSCLFDNIEVALTVLPMFLLPLMVFSGFFVNSNSIPLYFRWISYLSPMRYGFIALAKNEFTGLVIHCKLTQRCSPGYSGEDVIKVLGFDDEGSVEQNAAILFVLSCGFLSLAYVALWWNVRKLNR